MSRTKTGLFALALSLAAATPGLAQNELVATFASCVGRLSAQLEHQWLMSDAASARTEQQRGAMIELLDVVSHGTPGRRVLELRIGAKFAHAALLTRATFNDDPDDAQWARRRAGDKIAACHSLLLS